jgi:hypothetical protein
MQKSCNRCKKIKQLTLFPKDSKLTFGYAGICKECKSLERKQKRNLENIRWNNYYSNPEHKKRHIVRILTRKKYGSAKDHLCKLCNNKASEWHHTEYKKDSIIPLCEPCHTELT